MVAPKTLVRGRRQLTEAVDDLRRTAIPAAQTSVDRVAPVVQGAGERLRPQLARARGQLEPAIEQARAELGPRVKEAREEIAPRVKEAREEIAPRVKEVRDQLAPVADEARRQGRRTAASLGLVEEPKKSHKLRNLLIVLGLGAVAAVIYKLIVSKGSDQWTTVTSDPPTGGDSRTSLRPVDTTQTSAQQAAESSTTPESSEGRGGEGPPQQPTG